MNWKYTSENFSIYSKEKFESFYLEIDRISFYLDKIDDSLYSLWVIDRYIKGGIGSSFNVKNFEEAEVIVRDYLGKTILELDRRKDVIEKFLEQS